MALHLARCEPTSQAAQPVRLARCGGVTAAHAPNGRSGESPQCIRHSVFTRLHPDQGGQAYVVLDDGTLQHVLLGPSGEQAVPLAQFSLLLQAGALMLTGTDCTAAAKP